jgi:hypothetical protein
MRAGETVIVCGASADPAQFEPFEWPEHSALYVGVGCGLLNWLHPGPEDASEDVRDEIARSYVRVACHTDLERATRGVSSWLRLIERAAKVPCAMVVACGGVRVSAVPIFSVYWNRGTITVSGASVYVRTRRRSGDEVVQIARRILAKRGIVVDNEAYAVRSYGARWFDFVPRDPCALCHAPIWGDWSTFIPAYERGQHGRTSSECSWMRIEACAACGPCRSFRLWGVELTVGGDVSDSEEKGTLFDEGAHESAWQAGGRVVVTLALALTRRAEPRIGTFAAALASALCDMKLLRVVADRFVFPAPPPGPSGHRALGMMVERERLLFVSPPQW